MHMDVYPRTTIQVRCTDLAGSRQRTMQADPEPAGLSSRAAVLRHDSSPGAALRGSAGRSALLGRGAPTR